MTAVARDMWTLFEPVHAVTYFAPEVREAYEAIGLRGYWRGYFAGRSAALGAVGPAPVVAAFYGFAPRMVERALPSVWALASPEATLAAREAGNRAALRRVLGDDIDGVAELAALLERAVDAAPVEGRLLGATYAALPRPADPLLRVWHACGVLREHRGDGHVAALVAAGVDGIDSLVWRVGIDLPREVVQPYRGWTDEEWSAAAERLARRGWLDAEGRVTDAGRAAHDAVEDATDLAAARPWEALGEDAETLCTLLAPLAERCLAELPAMNPIGLPARSSN
jgi:hypothetical protein